MAYAQVFQKAKAFAEIQTMIDSAEAMIREITKQLKVPVKSEGI